MRSTTLFLCLFAIVLAASGCSSVKKSSTGSKTNTGKTSTGKTTSDRTVQLRRNVVQYAKKYVGVNYKYAGTSPSTGFDCSGFTSYVLKEYGIKISPASASQAKEGRSVQLDRVQAGDIVVFGEGSKIQHVALVVERNKDGIVCIHSTSSRGVIIENVSKSSYWKPKILYARDMISK
jgi:cell wall-associated NlpC family hydrolase